MDHKRLEERMHQMAANYRLQLEAALADQKKDMQSDARDSIFRGIFFGVILGLFLGYMFFH